MSIANYSELVDAITGWMNDASLSAYAPDFIAMAEASFNRRLNSLEMEGTATITVSTPTVSLPTDYKGALTLYVDDENPLGQLGASDFATKWNGASTGRPENFSLYGGVVHLAPEPDTSYTLTMTYLRTLTPLSASNTTNWLLEAHPDLYLYASLLHGEFRGWNDDRLPMIGNAVDTIIAEINRHNARRKRSDDVGTVAASYF